MPERARFRVVSIWDEDDPGLVRLREALALQPTPEPVQDAHSASEAPEVEQDATRATVASLRDRVARGDRSAADRLRELLGRLRRG